MKKIIFSLIAALVVVPAAVMAQKADACQTKKATYQKASYTTGGQQEMDIVETAVSARMFNTLVAAVKAADLVDVLKSEGPFTVFAPTDDAFRKLPKGTVETLLKPENKDMLVSVLKSHVVPGKVMAAQVVKINKAETVQGDAVNIMVKGGGVFLNEKTKVTKTDIGASNGVIHVIDSVLMPPADMDDASAGMDIVETAVSTDMFNTLVAAVQAAGLVETLKGDGPFTVLAPTDEAFAKLPAGTVENLLKPENKDMLVKILTYHVISGEVRAADVAKMKKAKTVQGKDVKIKAKNGKVMINKANVVKTDVEASNGIIHVIDTVLMP
jgi:transforming growth factor-beta-induced protein